MHYCNFCAVLGLLTSQSQAQPAGTGAFRKGALDEEGEGEDGVVDQDEGGEDDPVELVDEPQIWLSVLHQAVVGVEDEESTEENVEEHGSHVHISRSEPCLGEGFTYFVQMAAHLDKQPAEKASVIVFDIKSKPAIGKKSKRTANS